VRIVTDTDNVLARAVALAPCEAVAASWDQVRAKIEECVDHLCGTYVIHGRKAHMSTAMVGVD
jgi:hypothetical protein